MTKQKKLQSPQEYMPSAEKVQLRSAIRRYSNFNRVTGLRAGYKARQEGRDT